jgi:hypothetical protein
MPKSPVFLLLLTAAPVSPQVASSQVAKSAETSLTAEVIMARVAVNQDRSEQLRRHYVYHQRIHVASRKTNGKLIREETTEYHVVPQADSTKKILRSLTGRCWHKGKYFDYTGEQAPDPDSLDVDLVRDLRDDLAKDDTKDSLGRGLFPLTSAEQQKYKFRLLGQQKLQGRDIYRIGFEPKDQKDHAVWKGEALIDAAEFQPVNVFTKLAHGVPLLVRTALGTNLPGIGFNVQYQRQSDGVWFPSTFGTEFRLHVLFFLNREVTLSLENTAFEHTHVDSRMVEVLGPVQ